MIEFIIGLFIGAVVAFVAMCIIASRKISDAYIEGFNHGRDYVLHRVDRGNKHEE